MAWTAPATATVGQIVTASFWNAQVRDNLNVTARLVGVQQFTNVSAYLTTSTTYVGLDGTANQTVTFTAPASGNVVWRLNANTNQDAGFVAYWRLYDGAAQVTNSERRIGSFDGVYSPVTVSGYVTGLTANQSYSWEWQHKTSDGAHNSRIYADPSLGLAPGLMEIWSAA